MITFHTYENVTCVEGKVSIGGKDSSVYLYLVDGLLIDTGAKILENELISFYEAASFEQVVLTHGHEDHVGTAAWIERNRNVPILIHENGIVPCSQPANYRKYRQDTWGIREPFTAQRLGDSVETGSYWWNVIYTPGHADDHVALYNEANGLLFSGDLYLIPKTKLIMHDESIPQIIASIRTLLAYDFQAMFCSHAGYLANGRLMLTAKLDYLENLSGDILHLYRLGLTPEEIDAKLFPNRYPIVEVSEREFDSRHIVQSVITAALQA